MSTPYFGALLRAAGWQAGVAAPPRANASHGADLTEIDAEREVRAPASPASRSPVAQPQQPVSPSPSSRAIAHAEPEAEAPRTRAAAAAKALPKQRDAQPAAPEAHAVAPPPLHAAVQAAVSWVASDPQGRADVSAAQMLIAESTVVQTQADISEIEEETQEAQGIDPDMPMQSDIDDEGMPYPSSPALVHRRAPAPRAERHMRASPAAAPREEAIEITIGAIHLHVEAPQATGVVPAAAPAPPPAAPSLRSPAPRSALSRRALYRL
ncbi:hypothetical protein QTI51_01815 [Variovorax sp. J22G73]|jgi:hypothetical protein|uniref:hypothetical protein n=1 Tax=unclassified Variovorax TaxID=663243 RepID=UPI0010513816|nr:MULTISPECIES: hypothetical protein [unclassified Variovorax]MDM0004339.1 hypothetical protein [Variovorax sp. J22R203]MDM0095995.1 hypothetical protein [Variovorax sp. J22G73]